MDQRISRKQTLVLICLFGILLTVTDCAAEDKQCEVLEVHATPNEPNSTFKYDITYKDPSCNNTENLRPKLKECNTTSLSYYGVEGVGKDILCPNEGMWMVRVSGVNSNCFHCLGIYMHHDILRFFTDDFLNLTMKHIHPAVQSWTLTIYETHVKADYFECKQYHLLETIKDKFQVATHPEPNITRSLITLKHSFDRSACYCLVLSPISHLPLAPHYYKFTTDNCRPTPSAPGNGVFEVDLPMSELAKIQWAVVVGVILCVVAMISVLLRSPVFLSKVLRLKQLIAGYKSSSEKPPQSCETQVLLVYVPDTPHSQELDNLRQNLQASFKVHDLFKDPNPKLLADPCGWTQEILLSTSSVKVVLVESVGLHQKIASLLESDRESCVDAMVAKKSSHDTNADSLLTFVLRTIIASSLRQDYSSVFVVRFKDEVKDAVGFLVDKRRYELPNHFSVLSNDMKEATRMKQATPA